MTNMPAGLTVLIQGEPSDNALSAWHATLKATGRPYELRTSTEPTGKAIREALPTITQPFVLMTDTRYPYTPADVNALLERIETPGELPDAMSGEWKPTLPQLVLGCRTGVPVPGLLAVLGAVVRGFANVVLGLPLQRLPGWYGFSEHLRAYQTWIHYGTPLNDPQCGFKLFRTSFLERFPIQSDGDFVHIELVAKATFLTCLMDEKPLSPKPDKIPKSKWDKKDVKTLNAKPKFWRASPHTL